MQNFELNQKQLQIPIKPCLQENARLPVFRAAISFVRLTNPQAHGRKRWARYTNTLTITLLPSSLPLASPTALRSSGSAMLDCLRDLLCCCSSHSGNKPDGGVSVGNEPQNSDDTPSLPNTGAQPAPPSMSTNDIKPHAPSEAVSVSKSPMLQEPGDSAPGAQEAPPLTNADNAKQLPPRNSVNLRSSSLAGDRS
ncbi:hypothetical protein BC629DRAFT_1076570 [Irpex lacteus]|nr:hypothetical protein BC629DRAFT_1076570 [Irpex lacteus]